MPTTLHRQRNEPMDDKYLYKRNNIWWIRIHVGGIRHRQSLGTGNIVTAREMRDGVCGAISGRGRASFLRATPDNLLVYLVRGRERAMRRDRARGRTSTLSPQDLRILFDRSGGKCEATGIPFSLQPAPNCRRKPYAPSLDRLDNSRPYSLDNCRLVCVAVNIAINEWGEEIFGDVAMGFLVNARRLVTALGHSDASDRLSA